MISGFADLLQSKPINCFLLQDCFQNKNCRYGVLKIIDIFGNLFCDYTTEFMNLCGAESILSKGITYNSPLVYNDFPKTSLTHSANS